LIHTPRLGQAAEESGEDRGRQSLARSCGFTADPSRRRRHSSGGSRRDVFFATWIQEGSLDTARIDRVRMTRGEKSNFHQWVPYVRLVQLLNPNRIHPKWHVRKQKFSAWHTCAYGTFCGMSITTIFFNGMCVNHSKNVGKLPENVDEKNVGNTFEKF
jgi:hypothetical protein